MLFYLVRHGQTDWNNEKRMQGHMNISMNDVGIQQIKDLADQMVRDKVRFDRLIASPLDRAKQSAG
jgi:probable phosphoglycerate mutase